LGNKKKPQDRVAKGLDVNKKTFLCEKWDLVLLLLDRGAGLRVQE
jgi:hypothetical protein